MREFEVSIDISAPIDHVWDALTDIDKYGSWNPIVSKVEGVLEVGKQLHHTLIKPNGRLVSFSPVIESVNTGRGFTLSKSLIHPKLIHLVHHFELVDKSRTSTMFSQRWQCTGFIVPLLWGKLMQRFKHFEKFNSAIKKRIESKER